MLAPCPRPGRPDEESVEKGQALVEAVLNPCARAAEMVVRRAWRGGCPSAGRSIAHAAGQESASPLPSAVLVPTHPHAHVQVQRQRHHTEGEADARACAGASDRGMGAHATPPPVPA